MKNLQLRFILSALTLCSIWITSTSVANAAPVRFEQIRQIINARPGKAATAAFEQLRLVGDDPIPAKTGDDAKANGGDNPQTQTTQQDGGRVITETTTEIVEDEVCDCITPTPPGRFPYALLGLGAVPFLFLIPRGKNTPTPTPPNTPPTETPTPTSETPTPTMTPTPTPPSMTPTPPPEPVPEPMTILLFGTGLAGVGMAARKRLGKQDKTDDAPEIQ